MGRDTDGKRCILIIGDDLSSYKWLGPTDSCSTENAAEALGTWMGCFSSIEYLVTDKRSHFKNVFLKSLIEEARTQHHFVTSYCSWSNGSAERIWREVLRDCNDLLS